MMIYKRIKPRGRCDLTMR